MAYVALYRKYRSQSFGEVIGQHHVTTVLQNAIRLGRIAHAYLFCGPRGCGKTSTARLLARALNCQAGDTPTAEPCGVCDLCLRIRDGSAIDVLEMDAASETGIDDVREKIIENAKYMPAQARFKVYIIDEVHDLSSKAFDSLLKTLEEPPSHVVFVLATTEAHKVPITIRSRCQRMDFRRGTLQDLVANVERVLQQEGVPYDREAALAVARAAEGSFRDSLSLLEQALAYTDGTLTAEAVHTSVGIVGPQLLDEVTQVLAADDLRSAFEKAGDLVESGKDVKQTLVALQAHLRDLLIAGIAAGPEALADVSPQRFEQLKAQSQSFGPQHLLRMLDILAEAERDLRFTNQHRLLLERALWSILPSSLAAAPPPAPAAVRPPEAPRAQPARPPAGSSPPPSGGAAAPRAARPQEPAEEPTPPPSRPPRGSRAASGADPTPPPAQAAGSSGGHDPRFTDGIDLDGVRRAWPRVVKRITQKARAAVAYFGQEEVVAVEGRHIIVEFPDTFKLERVNRPQAHEMLERMLAEEIGAGYKVRCVARGARPGAGQPDAAPAAAAAALDLSGPPAVDATAAETASAADAAPAPAGKPHAEQDFFDLVLEKFDGTEVDE